MIQGSTRDAFTQEELIRIYQHAGSAEQAALVEAAKQLFPQRMAAEEPPLLLSETGMHGRAFIRVSREDPESDLWEKTEAEVPAYTIKSGRCAWVGIMKDGTAIPY